VSADDDGRTMNVPEPSEGSPARPPEPFRGRCPLRLAPPAVSNALLLRRFARSSSSSHGVLFWKPPVNVADARTARTPGPCRRIISHGQGFLSLLVEAAPGRRSSTRSVFPRHRRPSAPRAVRPAQPRPSHTLACPLTTKPRWLPPLEAPADLAPHSDSSKPDQPCQPGERDEVRVSHESLRAARLRRGGRSAADQRGRRA